MFLDYKSKYNVESDVIKTEYDFHEILSTNLEKTFSICDNLIAEDICNDTEIKPKQICMNIAETSLTFNSAHDSNVKSWMKDFGKKTLTCGHCSYYCSREDLLTKHLCTHSGEKTYSCRHCSFICSVDDDITGHMHILCGNVQYSFSYSVESNPNVYLPPTVGKNHIPVVNALFIVHLTVL